MAMYQTIIKNFASDWQALLSKANHKEVEKMVL